MDGVKAKKFQSRRDRANATRLRIIEAANELFCRSGYASTTMESIASSAGVAVQTVYYTFQTKGKLLQQVIETAAAGEHDPLPVMERPWMRESMATPDGRRALALSIEHGVDIYARVAPLGGALRMAISSDSGVDDYWSSVVQGRRTGMRLLMDTLQGKGQLRPDLNPERAADVMFVVFSHETFVGLTHGCGWSVEEYKAWLYRLLCNELLSREVGHGADQSPTADLSFHSSLRDS